jgi:hypothetical protein
VIDYIQTRTGRLYWRRPEEYAFTVGEIAHCLARICRFNGHLGWESVAWHSVRVSRLVDGDARVKLAALLHDAHEAYTGDQPGPMLSDGLAGPLVAVGWGIQREIMRQLAPGVGDLSLAEAGAIHEADRNDCAHTLARGASQARADMSGDTKRFEARFIELAREVNPAAVLPSQDGGAEKTGADD